MRWASFVLLCHSCHDHDDDDDGGDGGDGDGDDDGGAGLHIVQTAPFVGLICPPETPLLSSSNSTHSTLRPLTQTQTEPQQRLPRQTLKIVRMTMTVF